jgi:hypothetical protein
MLSLDRHFLLAKGWSEFALVSPVDVILGKT